MTEMASRQHGVTSARQRENNKYWKMSTASTSCLCLVGRENGARQEPRPSGNLRGPQQIRSPPGSPRYLLRKERKNNLWALEAWSVNTLFIFLSGGVITDLTILWIRIQSNKHSWGDGRKYRFQVANVTSLLLHMSWSREEEMLNFLKC